MKHTIQKSIFCTLLLLLGVSPAAWGETRTYSGTEKLYFNMKAVSWWATEGNGGNFAYFTNTSTSAKAWSAKAEKETGDIWYVVVPAGTWDVVILTRNNTTTDPSWENKWNQTGNIPLDATSNYILSFSENRTTCTWSIYEVAIQQYVVAGNGNGMSDWVNGKDWSNSDESNLMDYADGVWSKTYTVEVHDDLQFKLCKQKTWDNAIGYSDSYQSCSNVSLSNSGGNIKFSTTALSTVTITYDGTNVCVQVVPISSCTTPPIEWSTAPAGGTAGGSMTASVTTNELAPTVTWSSSNTSVATVDANGKITYVAAGTTTISAKYTGDGITYCAEEASVSKEITVEAAPVWKIKGTFTAWADYIFVDNGDNTCSYTVKLSAASYYTFVIFSGGTYYKGGVITSSNHENLSLATSGNDNKITTVASGNYTFIWNYSTKQLTVTYPVSTTYTVTFHANGHGSRPALQKVESGQTASVPTPPTAEGYTFGGWYTESSCTNAYNFDTPVTANLDLYAKWTKDYSTASYYYFDEKHTGWAGTIDAKWKLVDAGDYAYVAVTAYSGTNNKFKIFPTNPKDDNNVYANGDNIATDELAGNIMLTAEGGNYNNIKIESTCDDYYVVLYYPGTTLNAGATPLVAAMYDLPGTTAYNVSFGVVDEMGGTITAKYGCSTITSGQLVTRATFTATPETGYVVEGWYSDEAGTTRIDAAGTSTTYSQAITEADNTIYVKFAKKYALYFKPNATDWDNIYAYTFTATPWEDGKGVHPKNNRSEYGQMSKLNDSVYYYNFTSTADITFFALNNDVGQADWGEFHGGKAVFRGDFHKDMPVFISQKGHGGSDVNSTKYYNEGVWMKFNDTDPGYNLGLRNQTDNNAYLDESYRFTAAKAGDYISTVTLNLEGGKIYSFLVKNDKGYYFTPNAATTCTSSNSHFELYRSGNEIEVVIQPTITGAYTFQLNLANGKVEIDVLYPTTEYRLVYVEKSGSTFVKFHPSHTIAVHDVGCDTVSLHVRPNVKSAEGTESGNPNTCKVWLQQFVTNAAGTGMEWVTKQEIDVKTTATITGNGVYNFVIEQAGGAATVSVEKIHPYTGNYFIRSDASKAGWDFASAQGNLHNRFWYSDYARQHETFDHYCCHWTTNGTNLNFVVANDYSYCLTDTLVQNAYEAEHNYVDATGQLLNSANIRFMWNSYDNSTDRAYLAGAGDNLFLLSQEGIYDMSGNQQTSLKFSDQQNWVYRLDIKSDPNAFIKIKAPYAGYTQYFKGSEEAYSFQLIKGLDGKTYNIRVIYDFKTNHLICAWLPEGEITTDESIETDMMIIRQNQGDARQLTFNPSERAVGEVKNVYCVLTLTKDYLSADTISDEEKKFYWISFPFDVRLSEVFGCGVYSNDYVIQYYDGAERAAKGCWADSPTYWRYYWDPTEVILKKGMGYVLYIDWEQILAQQFTHGNTEVSIYFPSANTEPMDISGQLDTVTIPEYKCTIERCDRYIYDSNWNIIGVPAYANIDKFGNPMIAQQIEDAAHGLTVGFMYVYQPEKYSYYVVACQDTTFRSMQAYMVQFGGTIAWQEKSVTGEVVPSQRMMRAATPDEEADRHTLRLVLQNAAAQQVDHTYIRTQETNVTNAFDLNYDLTKQFSSGANVYSLVGENRITLAANVLPMADAQKGVSIGVTFAAGGVYTLALPDGTDGLNVVLYDRALGTYTDLSLDGYTFESEAGTLDDRFELIVKSSSVTTQMADATASYVVYVDNGVVKVEGVDAGTTVRLFDTVGRLVWTRLVDGNLEIPAMAAGTYLLQIGNAVEKIVIR